MWFLMGTSPCRESATETLSNRPGSNEAVDFKKSDQLVEFAAGQFYFTKTE